MLSLGLMLKIIMFKDITLGEKDANVFEDITLSEKEVGF
jgi:hypothetical protein